MEPFNIRIKYNAQDVTLTILPEADLLFTVVYFGGVLGAIQKLGHDWKLIDHRNIPKTGLPGYKMGYKNSGIAIELTTDVANQVGYKIEQLLLANTQEPLRAVPAHLRRIKD
jgi:hypothetical protein